MYPLSAEYRQIELRARAMRAQALRDFFASIASKFQSAPALLRVKTA